MKPMEKIKMESPVLLFGPRFDSLEFIRNQDLLSITNKLGLKKGIVIGNFIVDSSGKIFKTIGAKKKGNYHGFWKFEFFNPLIFIELQVMELDEEIPLNELKQKIFKVIKRERGQWENYGNIDSIIRSIQRAETYRETILTIGKYIDP